MRLVGGCSPRRLLRAALALVLAVGSPSAARALPTVPGDLNDDERVRVQDAVLVARHFAGHYLPVPLIPLADLDQDGALDALDVHRLGVIVLDIPAQAPTRLVTSPAGAEVGVAITRETILRFGRPLATSVVPDASVAHLEFAGTTLPARLHLSASRCTLTIFPDDIMPSSARVRLRVDGDALIDVFGSPVDADGDGVPGGEGIFDFDTLSMTTLPDAVIVGRVLATARRDVGGVPEDEPLAGVRITVDTREDTLFAVTGADGRFRLAGSPVGRFFVVVDGAMATNPVPAGAYYPTVGKAWESRPGTDVDIGVVYLPLVPVDAMNAIIPGETTVARIPASVLADAPELQGVSVTVPRGSLYFNDGSPGTEVGIAPVDPDRLPGPLPDSLDFPVVITVQTGGAGNFDEPAPACFPNLPYDSLGGLPMAPGGAAELWSFNHDTGDFEKVGRMTVTPDGLLGCTDPGVGILAPGWHGMRPRAGTGVRVPAPCRSGNDKDAWKFARAAFGCIKNLNKLQQVVRALSSLADLALQVGNKTEQCRNVFETASHSDALACVQIAKSLCDAVKDAVKALSDYKPADVAIELAKCLGDLTAASASIACDARAGCRGQQWPAPLFCEVGVPLLNTMNSLLKVVDKYNQIFSWKTAIDGICASIDLLNSTLGGLAQPLAGNEPPEPSDEEVLAMFDAAIADTAAFLPTLQPELDDSEALVNQYEELVNILAADEGFNVMATVTAVGGWAKAQYVFRTVDPDTDEVTEERGVIAPDGTEDWSGRASATYSLALLSVANDAYVNVSGRLPPELSAGETPLPGQEDPAIIGSPQRIGCDTTPCDSLPDEFYARCVLERCPPQFWTPFPLATFTDSLLPEERIDTDADGLTDDVEDILGTDPGNADTDGDGLSDGAEVQQGLDPLDGILVRTGIIGSVDTPGNAVDTCAGTDVVAVADSASGVSLVSVADPRAPIVIARVDTPGSASRVACDGSLLLVADGASGLAIVDASDPPAARIVRQVALGGVATSVAASGGIAWVGLAHGEVVAVDLASGSVFDRLDLPEPVVDLALGGDFLYALDGGRLHAISTLGAGLGLASSVTSPTMGGPFANRRLFVGGGIAYAVHAGGYNTFDLARPGVPRLIAAGNSGQVGWRHVTLDGSGLAIAAVSVNFGLDDATDVYVHDASDPARPNVFITLHETPGQAQAVAIGLGLAYVADGSAGLQVVNPVAYDRLGRPPTIVLDTSWAGSAVESAQRARVTATVTDDVQVREVFFYIDDALVARDPSFPFEHRFSVPSLTRQPSFTLRARAMDTGGNVTDTETLVVTILEDATAPVLIGHAPGVGEVLAQPATMLLASFSEPMDVASLQQAWHLFAPGVDGLPGTADDAEVAGTVVLDAEESIARLTVPQLSPGFHRAVMDATAADVAGNTLHASVSWVLRVAAGMDADGDGLADSLEAALGLSATDFDSDDDGIPDGREDADGDRLGNADEEVLGTNPALADTDGDGIADGNEDADGDALLDADEFLHGANPFLQDTDGDLFPDGAEVDVGSLPSTTLSQPGIFRLASGTDAVVQAVEPATTDGVSNVATGAIVAGPEAIVLVADPQASGEQLIARPPATVEHP